MSCYKPILSCCTRRVLYLVKLDMCLYLKLETHGSKTCTSFRSSFCDYVVTSYCLNVALQHMNVETCSKTCTSLLPMYYQLYTIQMLFTLDLCYTSVYVKFYCSRITLHFTTLDNLYLTLDLICLTILDICYILLY